MIRIDYLKRCSQRITITLPFAVHQRLLGVSDTQGRSASNLGAFLIERALSSFYDAPVTRPK